VAGVRFGHAVSLGALRHQLVTTNAMQGVTMFEVISNTALKFIADKGQCTASPHMLLLNLSAPRVVVVFFSFLSCLASVQGYVGHQCGIVDQLGYVSASELMVLVC
jgi:hypothetical protein